MRLICSLVLLLAIGKIPLYAQPDTPSQDYSLLFVAKDLPDKRVNSILQDPQGFIWIGTFNGLFCYDGLRHTEYRDDPRSSNMISFNLVQNIWMMGERSLIIEGDRSINILDIHTRKITYRSPDNMVFVQSIRNGDQCYLYFEDMELTNYLLRLTKEGIVDSIPQWSPSRPHMDKACCDSRGNIYFFDKSGNVWQRKPEEGLVSVIDSTTFTGKRLLYLPELSCDAQDHVWALDNIKDQSEGGYLLTPGKGFIRMLDLPAKITLLPAGDPGKFWSFNVESKQLNLFDINTQTTSKLVRLPVYIKDISTILKDVQGDLWIGSHFGTGESILLAHPHLAAFHKLLYEEGKEELLGLPCRSLAELRTGEILIGTMEGIYSWTPHTKKIHLLPITFEDNKYLVSNIWKMIPDPDGVRVWFAKEEGGVFEYSLTDHYAKNFIRDVLFSNRSLGMHMDLKGVLWIGTASGITWFNTHTLQYEFNQDTSGLLYDINCYNWVETDENTFWACSSNGLFRFDSSRHMQRRYGTDTSPSLCTNVVNDIVKDGEVFWIATDNGLHRLENETITSYTVDQGLAHNSVAAIEMDEEGNVWIATFGGLSRLDKASSTFQNFYVEDGLPHNEFNRLGKLKTKDGSLYFSSQNGVLHFQPAEVSKTLYAPPLVLTHFYTYNEDGNLVEKPYEELSGLKSIRIPAGNKYFEVAFALLNYINPEGNRYSYYLEGLEPSWHPLNTIPVIQYNNLPKGKYVLHIRAESPSGIQSKNSIDLNVIVLQHYYQAIWFKALLLLLVFGLAFLVIRLRFMQKLKMERMRNRISRDLHDEVGGVLSGIAMQMDLFERRAPEDLKPYMKRIAESSRNAALKMRDVIWGIDSSKDHFQDLLERMKAYTLELLVPMDIRHNFQLHGIDVHEKLNPETRQNIYLIFKEAMNNIIKHARATEVEIKLENSNNMFIMTLTDNGNNVYPASNPKGQGLANMHKRAKQINGSLEIRQAKNGGIAVILTLPKNPRHPKTVLNQILLPTR